MKYKEKESIHQEFERFMRDEMDDLEKKYIKAIITKNAKFTYQNSRKFKKINYIRKKNFNFYFLIFAII